MAHIELLVRAWALLKAAQSLAAEEDIAGSAGLAYQAADLASKALAQAIDGSDPGSHRGRMRRAQQLLNTHTDKLDFLWELRQKDFYGDVSLGGAPGTPSNDEVREALSIVQEILSEIDHVLHRDADAGERPGQ